MNLDTIKYLIKNPARPFVLLGSKGLLNWMPDKWYVFIYSSLSLGYRVNLKKPRTFNEKLQWLKLYDRKPEYSRMVDKYAARELVAEKIGREYLIPLVGGPWNSEEEIDFDALPERFVLKTTHDSGGVIICRNKAEFDVEAAKAKLKKRLKRKYYYGKREWPYKDVPPRIIAEEFLEDKPGADILDYKFFCFNGVPKIMYITREMSDDLQIDFFDMDGKHLELKMTDERDAHVTSDEWDETSLEQLEAIKRMKPLAELLSEGTAHLRVDFYLIDGKIYFGELTF